MTALDVGANNLVACTTTAGQQYLYDGRDVFEPFREPTEHIAQRQATVKREESRDISVRIQRLYRSRTRRRDHAQNALVRDLLERLHEDAPHLSKLKRTVDVRRFIRGPVAILSP